MPAVSSGGTLPGVGDRGVHPRALCLPELPRAFPDTIEHVTHVALTARGTTDSWRILHVWTFADRLKSSIHTGQRNT